MRFEHVTPRPGAFHRLSADQDLAALLLSGDAAAITGQEISICGGASL